MVGRTHLRRSLKTDSLTVANRLAAKCVIEATAVFDQLRQSASTALLGEIIPNEPSRRSVTFEVLCDRYLNDPTSSRTSKSLHAYKSALSVLIELIGPTTPPCAIDRGMCREVMGVLTALPRNARKRWPNRLLRDIAHDAADQAFEPMSVANVNEYMNKLSTLLNWAVREEHCAGNPAKGLRLPQVQSAKNRRNAFKTEQLQSIFNAPLFRGCIDDENGYANCGDQHPRRSRFWVPLLSLFCGLRLNEACQLLASDISEHRGVLCITISADDDQKTLKTAASQRIVPVHPELLKIGLAGHVRKARSTGQARLFDEIKLDSFGMHSGAFSKWFSRFLVTCGAAAPKTCFHSFRHSFRDALRNGGVDREVALALGGWSTPSGYAAVGDAYGDGFDPRVLFSEITKLNYADLDLSHLHIVAE